MSIQPEVRAVPLLETERLRLRALQETDAEAIFEMFSDEAVTQYYNLDVFTDLSDAKRLIARLNDRLMRGDSLRWAVALKASDRLIGTCGFTHFELYARRGEVGYDLARAYWGKGYATEALGVVVAYGFEELHLHRIEAMVLPENVASARVLEKSGFREEGMLRDYGYWRGRFWDLRMYARLEDEVRV